MRRALVYFVQLAILVVVAVWLADKPGAVEIEWLGYRIETYFAVLIVIAGVAALLLGGLLRLWRGLTSAPGTFLSRRQMRRREAGYRALVQGMTAVAVGDRDEARQMAQRADALLQDRGLTRLLSAQAAALNGDEAAARRYFEALSNDEETAFLGLTGLMRQAMREGDDDRTLALATDAHRIRPHSGAIMEILFDLQTRRGHWADAQATLFGAVRRGVRTEEAAIPARVAIFTARAHDAEQAGQGAEALKWAEDAVATSPDAVPAAILRARILTGQSRIKKAARGLEEVWRHAPHPDIAAAYLNLWPDDPAFEKFRRIQTLVGDKAPGPTARSVLARAALDAKFWGEARRALADLDESERTVSVCRLMARLEDEGHGDDESARRWREEADNAPPDPAWTCDSCGAVGGAWAPLCGNCGGFAMITWKRPPRVTVLPASMLEEMAPADDDAEAAGDQETRQPNVIELPSRSG